MLDIRRLIKNLANIKHKETAKNKFLKTKPKVQEMKQNGEKAKEEAEAIHDYVRRGTVITPAESRTPILERDSISKGFEMVANELLKVGQQVTTSNGTVVTFTLEMAANKIRNQIAPKMEIGIAVTNAGTRYLTTRARSEELGGSFTPMNNGLATSLFGAAGVLR